MPVFRKNAAATRSQRLSHPLGCVTAQREQVLRRSASGTPTENEPNADPSLRGSPSPGWSRSCHILQMFIGAPVLLGHRTFHGIRSRWLRVPLAPSICFVVTLKSYESRLREDREDNCKGIDDRNPGRLCIVHSSDSLFGKRVTLQKILDQILVWA